MSKRITSKNLSLFYSFAWIAQPMLFQELDRILTCQRLIKGSLGNGEGTANP